MNFMIPHFLSALFIFHSVTSDTSQISKYAKEIGKEIDTENGLQKYANASVLSLMDEYHEIKLENFKQGVRIHKLKLSTRLLSYLIKISEQRRNTTRQVHKILYDIEILRYSIKESLRKTYNPKTLEDLLLSVENEELMKELEKSLNQLRILKFNVYAFNNIVNSFLNREDVNKAINKLDNENSEEVPLQMSWNNNDVNDGESFLKFHIDLECDEIETLQRLSLMVQDELNEMPKPKNGVSEDQMQSESNTRTDGAIVPLWLLHEKDIEEIQLKYVTWMTILETSDKEGVKMLREAIAKSGQSIKLFSRTLAVYYNLTTKLLECTSHEDEECEKMINEIISQEHFQEYLQILAASRQSLS